MPDTSPQDTQHLPVVAIGASAGGIQVFERLFDRLPADAGAAYVVIQHMMPDTPSHLPEILRRRTKMDVQSVDAATPLRPNTVYVIPPGKGLTTSDGEIEPIDRDPRPREHLPIDGFFRALAKSHGPLAVGVVLSGTGGDGSLGVKAIKAAGGLVLVQRPSSADFAGMPHSAATTHAADYVLDIDQLAEALVRFLTRSYPYIAGYSGEAPDLDGDRLEDVLKRLRQHTRRDFRPYKRSMLVRRVGRRMGLAGVDTLADYQAYLDDHPDELDRLFRDLLVSVTDFFRDRDAYASLQERVLPALLDNHTGDEPLRIWVPACATGEEAYSLAILCYQIMEERNQFRRLQIFATDVDADALEVARLGRYPESIVADVAPEQLQRYFEKIDHHYQVGKTLRETVVFAEQSLLADPPFSRLELISCRNLLIYLEEDTQQRLLSMFHFALADSGYLFLGSAETIGDHSDLFEPLVRNHRIYRRLPAARREYPFFPDAYAGTTTPPAPERQRPRSGTDLDHIAQHLMLREYVPASVLINHKAEVLCAYGATQQYLSLPTGETRLDLMDMAAEDIRNTLRAAVHKANRDKQRTRINAARDEDAPGAHSLRIVVRPLVRPKALQGLLLVTFEPAAAVDPETLAEDGDGSAEQQLAEELRATQDELQSTIQALETSNEDLKGSNEEILSMNEELQSTNEELETSKEELQSLNEELTTVNSELRSKVDELERANDDMANLFSGTQIGILFLDRSLHIQRFTPAVKTLVNLIDSDIDRPLADIKLKFDDEALLTDARAVLSDLKARDREVRGDNKRWYLRGIRPYRTSEDNIRGLVVTFTDITALKQAAVNAEQSERQLRLLANALPVLIAYVDAKERITFINATCKPWFGIDPDDMRGRRFAELFGEAHYRRIRDYVASALAGKQVSFDDRFAPGKANERFLHATLMPAAARDGAADGFYALVTDVSEQRHRLDKLLDSQAESAHANRLASMSELAATIAHQLNQPLGSITSYAGALRRQLAGEDQAEARTIVEKIRVQSHTASDILNELREFIGRRTLDEEDVDLNALVRRVINLTEARIDIGDAEVRLHLASDLPEFRGSPVQLEQVLVNLVVNALEAMENCDTRCLSVGSEADGRHLTLSVADTGAGIAADAINQIFQPFYTSKDRGMGMGLAICRSIVEENGGSLWAESEEGAGTAFYVQLPLSRRTG